MPSSRHPAVRPSPALSVSLPRAVRYRHDTVPRYRAVPSPRAVWPAARHPSHAAIPSSRRPVRSSRRPALAPALFSYRYRVPSGAAATPRRAVAVPSGPLPGIPPHAVIPPSRPSFRCLVPAPALFSYRYRVPSGAVTTLRRVVAACHLARCPVSRPSLRAVWPAATGDPCCRRVPPRPASKRRQRGRRVPSVSARCHIPGRRRLLPRAANLLHSAAYRWCFAFVAEQ